jgi:RTX calcium-binding nonapeptide repeat (4 copies)
MGAAIRCRHPVVARSSLVVMAVGALVLAASAPALAMVVRGTPHADRLVGGDTADKLIGRGGADVLRGRGGGDLLLGGAARDRIKPGKAFDEIRAGDGRDLIRARDRGADLIDCGSGRDRVVVDLVEDGVFDCERIVEPEVKP